MRKVKPTKDVCKFLNAIKVEKIFKQLWKRILELIKDPNLQDSIKIGENKGNIIFRNDIGEYRIIYYFDDQYLYLMLIGKRNDDRIYRIYNRKIN